MVMKTRDIGDADRFVIIRAFTRMPRDVAANLPDAAVGLRQVVPGRRRSIARPVFHDPRRHRGFGQAERGEPVGDRRPDRHAVARRVDEVRDPGRIGVPVAFGEERLRHVRRDADRVAKGSRPAASPSRSA